MKRNGLVIGAALLLGPLHFIHATNGSSAAERSPGPAVVAPLGEGLFPLPCKTPIAAPYSRRKGFVAGDGLLQALFSTPKPCGMGGNVAGPSLQVTLAGHAAATSVHQRLAIGPVPTVVTCWKWSDVEVEQAVFAAAPEEQGFFVRVTATNQGDSTRELERNRSQGGKLIWT
jgi:hypothetical protein